MRPEAKERLDAWWEKKYGKLMDQQPKDQQPKDQQPKEFLMPETATNQETVVAETTQPETAAAETVIGFDTETHRIAAEHVAPKLVCVSAAIRQGDKWSGSLASTGDGNDIKELVDSLFSGQGKDAIKVACNAKFDLTVLCNHDPSLFPVIFQQLEDGRISDVIIREKLMNLTESGDLENGRTPDGVGYRIKYDLASLVQKYIGTDISASKTESDSWRLNFSELDGIPTDKWPEEAQTYAADDAKFVVDVYTAQEVRRQDILKRIGHDPFAVEAFRVAVDFALGLMTCWGMCVDPEAKKQIEEMLVKELAPEKLNLLIDTGILVPATPERPHAKGAKNHAADCPDPKTCNCPPKMVKGTEESINTKKLKAYVEQLAKGNPEIKLAYTEPSEKFPEGQLQVDRKFLEEYWHLDPVLEQYRHRQKLQKLVTTELPRMNNADGTTARIVHPCYDVLKETGRTSSFATDTYPSFNGQNVDPRARGCYIPRPGNLLLGADYSQMELGTAAQTCLELFGESVLAEVINSGRDPHAYLGAVLAYSLDAGFREVCDEMGVCDAEAVFAAFMELKDDPATVDIYKKYRKFAKPTGLGYPGGLGPKTFIQYAKATFGVQVDMDTATQLREIWREAFPEMVKYHEWINTQIDPNHVDVDADGQKAKRYCYTSPMGMYRANAAFCAAANGKALQTPSAEGALLAVFNVVRASYDPTMGSVLYGVFRPILFIHDEIIGEISEESNYGLLADELTCIMARAMMVITPNVSASANAVLMRRWSKDAEPVYDEAEQLMVWEPKESLKEGATDAAGK